MYKGDIGSAYRRVPLKPEHRPYATVAYKHKGSIVLLQHMAAPFGGISSVHHWEREGQFLDFLGRHVHAARVV